MLLIDLINVIDETSYVIIVDKISMPNKIIYENELIYFTPKYNEKRIMSLATLNDEFYIVLEEEESK